jgi:hypothetical protein
MEKGDLERRFHLMQKGIEAVALTREYRPDLKAAIDSLKIGLEVLKSYRERTIRGLWSLTKFGFSGFRVVK